ncbi:response regulator transcription factor [Dactylosporangium sp. NPDC005572]|uniref:response regulator transcription factor n=1 Tax=Dactylosporangium sp. NPDC005572 TaxID=3156889 RepID=UPI00339FEA53
MTPTTSLASRSVLLVDDHRVFTDVLAFALDAQPGLRCVAVANSAGAALATAAFDIAIVDLQLPDGDGLDVVRELRARHPAALLIVLTGHPGPGLTERARAAGADAALAKDDALGSVLDAIRRAEPDAAPSAVPHLSPRERQVLALLATGAPAGRIAAELGLSLHTVRDYVKALLAKLGARSQLDAVAVAGRLGLLARPDRFR